MKISSNWPKPAELIKNEIKTLEWFSKNTDLWSLQGKFSSDATRFYSGYVENYKKRKSSYRSFSFSSRLVFTDSYSNNPLVSVAFIECSIVTEELNSSKFSNLSYAFSLCNNADNGKIALIKKFHIDYTQNTDTGRPPLHPISHLQIPGTLSGFLSEQGLDDQHLCPSLSEPKIFCIPTTLALLTDFLLREFGGNRITHLAKLTDKPAWLGLIRENEDLILKPFFNSCNQFFMDRKNRKAPAHGSLFTQHFIYDYPRTTA